MSDKMTQKQESFALKFVECGNASEAYRHAYNVGENTKPETIWVKACALMAGDKVSARVFELQQMAIERTLVTVASITVELDENRTAARELFQPAAMNAATMGKAKLHGLLVERSEAKVDITVESPKDKLGDYMDAIAKRGGKTSATEQE